MRRYSCIILILCMSFLITGCAGFKRSLFESGLSLERKLSGMKEKTLRVNELTVSYLERPGLGETIVLLHGFSADKDNWVRFTRHLPKDYRVVAIDLPGHGSSTRDPKTTYSIDYITQGFANTVEALKIERFHLAGNSMGGYVSALYSASHPQRVQTLCLIDPAGATSFQPSDREISLSRGVNPLVPKTRFEFENTLSYGFHNQPFLPWPARSVYADRYIERSAFNEKMWSDLMENRVDVGKYLGDIRMPALLMWGERDRIIHVSTVEVFQKGIPHVKTVIFKECGHMPMVEIPKESARVYAAFIEENMQGRSPVSMIPGEMHN